MSARTRTIALAVGGAVVLASGAYALGSQAGGGDATAARSPELARPDGPRPGLDALARRLDVSPARLRAALRDLWRSRQPMEEQERSRLAGRLAAALGLPEARVSAALTRLRDRYGPRRDLGRHPWPGHPGPPPGPGVGPGPDAGVGPGPDAAVGPPPGALRGPPPGFRHGPPPGFRRGGPRGLWRARPGLPKGPPPGFHGGPPRPLVDALAHELGVSSARVRSALERLRAAHRSDARKRRDRFVAALAARLHIPAARVEAALPAPPGPWRQPRRP